MALDKLSPSLSLPARIKESNLRRSKGRKNVEDVFKMPKGVEGKVECAGEYK